MLNLSDLPDLLPNLKEKIYYFLFQLHLFLTLPLPTPSQKNFNGTSHTFISQKEILESF